MFIKVVEARLYLISDYSDAESLLNSFNIIFIPFNCFLTTRQNVHIRNHLFISVCFFFSPVGNF